MTFGPITLENSCTGTYKYPYLCFQNKNSRFRRQNTDKLLREYLSIIAKRSHTAKRLKKLLGISFS